MRDGDSTAEKNGFPQDFSKLPMIKRQLGKCYYEEGSGAFPAPCVIAVYPINTYSCCVLSVAASEVAERVVVCKPNSSVNGQLPRQPGVSKFLCLLKKRTNNLKQTSIFLTSQCISRVDEIKRKQRVSQEALLWLRQSVKFSSLSF